LRLGVICIGLSLGKLPGHDVGNALSGHGLHLSVD
jgi:hypothetical protein